MNVLVLLDVVTSQGSKRKKLMEISIATFLYT